ncbi:MAG: OB-fold nucleic acid binding domain-containing protein [Acidobacteriia bacterium]|nr:OB-fold nucleic acid binding domain-containing protein [Terriglobia bacterium]
MIRLFLTTILGFLVYAGAWAHDPKLHKGNPVTGQVVSVSGDAFDMKTSTGNIKVTFSSKTKFEHGKEVVDKSHLQTGDRVGVIGTKLPTGELVAKEILLGMPAPNKGGTAQPGHKH